MFTDLCVVGEHGLVAVGKTLTTPHEPARAIEMLQETLEANGISDCRGRWHRARDDPRDERDHRAQGLATALLATAGHNDAIEIARERRYEIYDLDIDLRGHSVPRHLRFDVPERTLADGTIDEEVDLGLVERLAR